MEQVQAICAENGWTCDDLTHEMAVELLSGNAVDIDWTDPSVFSNGSPIDYLLFTGSLLAGGVEKGAWKGYVPG